MTTFADFVAPDVPSRPRLSGVMETGDGCHRIMIAVGEWAQAVANEGNRCAIGLTEASVPWQDIVSRASDALFDATSDFRSMPNHFLTRDEFNHLARPVITRAVQEVLSIAPRDSTTKEPTPKLR